MRPTLLLIFLCGTVALLVAIIAPPSASAQSNCITPVSCSYTNQQNLGCWPPIPPEAFNCYGLDFTVYCSVRTPQCPPSAAPVELPRCIECEKARAAAGLPINLANGDVYMDETDVSIPGLGGGLTLTRAWNSLWPTTQFNYRSGMFGPNWVSNFEERIFVGDDGFIKYLHSDGNFWSFGFASSSWLPAAPVNAPAVLTQNSTNWILTFKNGEKRLFSLVTGQLTSIVDRNGNTTTLTYDGLNRLTTVTDAASRQLTFSYTGSSYQVASVSSGVGLSLSYSYDNSGRLLQVTKPDQSTLNFQYDSVSYFYAPTKPNPHITAVTDGSGKILESHTYDCYGRGLSSARAGGVESLTITYSDGTYSGVCGGGRVNSVE